MTCQVVLYNKLGIALASDSAVTSSRGKVMMGSEKIFELKPPHKLAVLTSGNSVYMSYPWEVVFSAWSETLHNPLGSIEEYYQSLSRYLKSMVSVEVQNNYIGNFASEVASEFREIFDKVIVPFYRKVLDDDNFEIFRESGWDEELRIKMTSLLTDDVVTEVHSQITSLIATHKENYEMADEVSDSQVLAWVDDFLNSQEVTFEDRFFVDWPRIPSLFDYAKRTIATKITYPDFDYFSEICLVGYGSRDLFPSAYYFAIHGCLGSALILSWKEFLPPTPYATRLFFGQRDAIWALFAGEDQLLTETAINTQNRALMELSARLASLNDESAKLVNDFAQQQREFLGQEIRKVGRERRGQPFFRAIGMAPMLDLAEFASQLVGIQSAFSAMSQDNPTVGGTIDVAIITHRDGFQWIRQKGQ